MVDAIDERLAGPISALQFTPVISIHFITQNSGEILRNM